MGEHYLLDLSVPSDSPAVSQGVTVARVFREEGSLAGFQGVTLGLLLFGLGGCSYAPITQEAIKQALQRTQVQVTSRSHQGSECVAEPYAWRLEAVGGVLLPTGGLANHLWGDCLCRKGSEHPPGVEAPVR